MAETERAASQHTETVTDALRGMAGENLLVQGPPMVGKRAFVYGVLDGAAGAGRDVLAITATRGADRIPVDLEGAGDVEIVDCSPGGGQAVGPVTRVSSPADLTGISMPVSRFLSRADRPFVVLDGISSLLLYTDEVDAFRFLSVLTAHVRRADGLGLYTLDEGCHDDGTVRTFTQLFDGQVELRESAGETGAAAGPKVRVQGVDGLPTGWLGSGV